MGRQVVSGPLGLSNNSKEVHLGDLIRWAFGTEVRIPIEFRLEPLRAFDLVKLAQSLDKIEEKRKWVSIRMAEYQNHVARQVERLIKPRAFNKGEFLL